MENSTYTDSQNRQKIDGLISFICKCYGNNMVDYINAFIHPKISGKNLTIEEFTKMLNEDGHFKILSASVKIC